MRRYFSPNSGSMNDLRKTYTEIMGFNRNLLV